MQLSAVTGKNESNERPMIGPKSDGSTNSCPGADLLSPMVRAKPGVAALELLEALARGKAA
jgi:hypothetical protein